MSKQLYVANLDPAVEGRGLTRLFAAHGVVRRAEVLPCSGVAVECTAGLVEMASEAEGEAAILALDGHEQAGRFLAVTWATPRQSASAAAAPMFGSMNMPDAADAPVNPGPARLHFGDPGGRDGNRGLPPTELPPSAAAAVALPGETWGPIVRVDVSRAPFCSILATAARTGTDVA